MRRHKMQKTWGKKRRIRHSPDYGGKTGHLIFQWVIRRLGPRPAYVLLGFVVCYYALARQNARKSASYYLRHRFPGDGNVKRFFRTIYYFYQFGQVLIDQAAIGILGKDRFLIEFPESEKLLNLAKKRNGIVLITSHVGNWQTAMSSMEELELPISFLFQLEEHTKGRHFFDLSGEKNRFNTISPSGFLGGMIEVINALKNGECIATMGDRAWGTRTKRIDFLGEKAPFPIMPYHLISITGAYLVMPLIVRTGPLAFRIESTYLSEGTDWADWTKVPRDEAINVLSGRYVRALEGYLERYPYMWFNFFDFWNQNN